MSGSIHRVKKSENFVVLDTTCSREPTLSFKAKGIHNFVMQLPPDWEVNIADLEKRSTDGRDSVTSGVEELMEAGFVFRELSRSKGGKLNGYDYHFFERPEHLAQFLKEREQQGERPQERPEATVEPTTSTKPAKAKRKAKKAAYAASDVALLLSDEAAELFELLNKNGAWPAWLEYKKKEHRFTFKTADSHSVSFEALYDLCKGDAEEAQKIILQSMANGWKGLFAVKTTGNEKRQNNNGTSATGTEQAGGFWGKGNSEFFQGA